MVVEALATAVWLAQLLPSLRLYDASVVVAIAARAVVGALCFVSGRALRERRTTAARPAALVLLSSATLRAAELGALITPSNLSPTWRIPVLVSYAGYACAAAWILWRSSSSVRAPR
jgi:hypothetical protein